MEDKKILYGSEHCPSCGIAKEFLEKNNIEFTYVDITESMKSLKEFLKIRDNHDVYRGIRGRAIVGIPMLKIGEQIILGPCEENLSEILKNA